MKLYSGLTQTIQTLKPKGDSIKIYVCGITPYDTTHLGHAFTYTVNDILIRYLELRGYQVRYAQNVTDIDDDILRKAKEVGENWISLGNYWTNHFIDDMISVNVRPPDFYPRATEFIPEIISINEQLVEKKLAYVSEGNVYFNIDAWPEFGKLSRLPRVEMLPIANERGNKPEDPLKRNPLDFVLWQAKIGNEPAWNSPWGLGRPGWHIECSAMSSQLLGETIDIHSGGADLLFPHHECEIAQLEPVTGKQPFVRFWLHAAMVYHQGEKMSKSLGNLIMCRNILRDWSPDALRYYLASKHYRKSWSYDLQDLKRAGNQAELLRQAVSTTGGTQSEFKGTDFLSKFHTAMEDDLNTPTALNILDLFAENLIKAARIGKNVKAAQQELRQLCSVFGLRLDDTSPEQRVIQGWEDHKKRFQD